MKDELSKTVEESLIERLVHELNSIKEPRNLVITLHLFIEVSINMFLESYFKDPKGNLPRYFKAKFNLIKAIGFLNDGVCKNIEAINKIRNRFAHDINAELEPSDFSNIYLSSIDSKKGFKKLGLVIKLQILSTDTILDLNHEFSKFLSERSSIIKKGIKT